MRNESDCRRLAASAGGCIARRWPLLVLLFWAAAVLGRADGEQRWAYVMDSSSLHPRIESSPAIDADGTVYLGVTFNLSLPTGRVVALVPNGTTGVTEKWRFDTADATDASPTIGPDGTLYIGCFDGNFYALDKNTGAEKWHFDTNTLSLDPTYIYSSAAVSRDGSTVYVGFGANVGAPTGGGICAFSNTGQLLWVKNVANSVECSPVIGADGTIYAGDFDGVVYALNPDGTEKWHRQLSGQVWGSPAIGGDGTIYLGTLANVFVALTPNNQVKWQRQFIVPGGPAVGPDGTVYVGSFGDSSLYALNPGDGSTKWQAPAQPLAGATPTVRADGAILFAGVNNSLSAYSPADGSILWSRPLKGSVMSTPAISPTPDHGIYVGAADTLYAFAGNASGLSQYSSWPTFQHDMLHTGRAAEQITGAQLVNLAARGPAGPGRNLIAGLTLKGSGTKEVLIRAVGPTLGLFGVANPLPDPALTVHVTPTFAPYSNNDWGQNPDPTLIVDAEAKSGAFPLPVGSKDAAVLANVDATLNYTTTVESADGQSGVAMVEVYDAQVEKTAVRLANLSTRGYVGNGEGVLIAGVSVGGTGKLRLLVRAVGPGLTQYGVAGVLAQPSISVYDHTGQLIGTNTGWTSGGLKGDLAGAFSLVGAFPLSDTSTDSALILSLSPGTYTFHVSGVGGTTGEAMVEAYALPY